MYSRILLAAAAATSLIALSACATNTAADPGINAQEKQVLTSNYYWRPDLSAPSYTSEQLDQLLNASADPTLDGEGAELQASRVAAALASVGDERFSDALSHQSVSVKRAVSCEIRYMWTLHHLPYPKTQHLLQPYI